MTIYGLRIPAVFSLLIWIGLWEVVGQLKLAFILPPFSSVVGELSTLILRPDFQAAALRTLESFAIGMSIAIVGGISIGFVMGRSEIANSLLGMLD